VAVVPGGPDQELIGITIADGAVAWDVRTPTAPIDGAVWSPDGSHFAATTAGIDDEPRAVLVVEAATDRLVLAPIPEDAVLQGFDAEGGLVIRQRLPAPQATTATWRFLRFDPVTSVVERLIAAPDVGPASNWSDDVHPAAGIAVESVLGDDDKGTVIRLWNLAGGGPRELATFASVDRIALDPAGGGVAISVADTIRYVALDGRARDLYSGDDPIADFGWSAAGDYLAVATDRPGPNLTVVEAATGRSVLIPQPDPVAQSLFVRIVGGVPLPDTPLPVDEPGPSPTPAASGPDVAGFPGLLQAWVAETPDGHRILHLESLVPTDGGIRVAAAMPVIDLGPIDPDESVQDGVVIRPRPGSGEILVWTDDGQRSRGWLWDGAAGVTPLALPADWPAEAYDIAWRPDGKALAASASASSEQGDFFGIFVVAEIGAAKTTVIPLAGDYDRLEGWWSQTELRVGHGICTEGCAGVYAFAARLRIADGRLTQLTPADRARSAIDTFWVDNGQINLSMINEDTADDIRIDWPGDPAAPDAAEPLGFAADNRTFLVAVRTADGTDLAAIADPVGRAVDGRLRDPRPTVLGHIDGRGLVLDVAPDQAWVIARDRVENLRLVRLSDGRSWALDRDRVLAWR
jgi:hypothetical protein